MDQNVMLFWVKYCLRPIARKLPPGKKGILLMDNFSAHEKPDIRTLIEDLNFEMIMLPPNVTGYLQPMDIGVNSPFKSYYSDQWEGFMLTNSNKTPSGYFQAASKEKIVTWISNSWKKISEDQIQKSFNIYQADSETNAVIELPDSKFFEDYIADTSVSDHSSVDSEDMDYEIQRELLNYHIIQQNDDIFIDNL